ncbi:MAG: hypothetical protein Q9191_007656 [Dirinaria sp. TL-2023a]
MALQSTISTKFLVISDTHNFEFDDSAETSHPLQLPVPTADVLLHCGDLTHCGGVSSFKRALKMLGSIDAELKLIIPGNHDLELDKHYWEAQTDYDGNPEDPEDHLLAVEAMTGPLAKDAGVTYLDEGTHSLTLRSGATFSIYVSPYTPAFCDWAFAYPHHEDRFNTPYQVAPGATSVATNPIPENVDIVMTHGPPKGILDGCAQGNAGCDNILQAIRRVKPMMHCFGHIHEGNGIKVVDWKRATGEAFGEGNAIQNPYPDPFVWKDGHGDRTLAVNAAIMTADNKPENAPWLISLDLPRSL